jgi:hypothetical protein
LEQSKLTITLSAFEAGSSMAFDSPVSG